MLQRSQLFRVVATKPGTHIYELRTYTIIPKYYDDFNRLAMQMMSRRPHTGKCQGYWTVQMGGLNQYIHIWEYDDLKHRYDCRKLLEGDNEWRRSYIKPSEQMISHQSNMLMRLVHREATASTMSYKYMMQVSPEKDIALSGPSAILAATFEIVVGEQQGHFVHVVKAKHLDDVIPVNSPPNCSSKILGPARWSSTLSCLWL